MIDLTGRHVLVVGGGRGIGAATARTAAGAGAAVSVTYRSDAAAADQLVKEIGGSARAYRADAADLSAMTAVVADSVAASGPVHGLVVSAGVYDAWLPIGDLTPENWDRIMVTNMRSTFVTVKAAAPEMPDGGSIVIYTSTAGQSGAGGNSAYAASKAAQIMFMRSAAEELAPQGIRVNCIAPAWTETESATPLIDDFGRDGIVGRCLLGRTGVPDDIAGPTCFLLSDLAAYMTGSTMTVDGGQAMRG